MVEHSPDPLRQRLKQIALEAQKQGAPYRWFEDVYAEAKGNAAQVPWAQLTPHPFLQDWLNNSTLKSQDQTALVIGSGLGDDAEALAASGFQVTAFDVSPSAIAWSKQRFPDTTVNYQVADLFALNSFWHNTFDLVFECRNLQSLPLSMRTQAIAAIAPLVAPQGCLLVVTGLRAHDCEPEGPPWPLSNQELAQFEGLGFREVQRQLVQMDDASIQTLRVEYRRVVPDTSEL